MRDGLAMVFIENSVHSPKKPEKTENLDSNETIFSSFRLNNSN